MNTLNQTQPMPDFTKMEVVAALLGFPQPEKQEKEETKTEEVEQ